MQKKYGRDDNGVEIAVQMDELLEKLEDKMKDIERLEEQIKKTNKDLDCILNVDLRYIERETESIKEVLQELIENYKKYLE